MTTSSLNPGTATTDEELRLSALHHATTTTPSGSSHDQVLERAEAYLAFLQGRTEKTQGAAADSQVANTVHVHFDRADTEREPGEAGRRKCLVRSIVKGLRGMGQTTAAIYVELSYGEVR